MIHTPLFLRWFKVNPLAPCPIHWSLHQATISEILHFFGRITEWLSSSARDDLFNLPSTLMMPLSLRNGSSFTMQLTLGTISPSSKCFFSLTNDWSCTILNNRSCAFWGALTSIESCNWIIDAARAILFNHISLILISRAITFFILFQFHFSLWSRTKTPFSPWTVLTLWTFLFSGSSSSICSKMLQFFNEVYSFLHRNDGPSNHLLIFYLCLDSKPLEVSSAELLVVST